MFYLAKRKLIRNREAFQYKSDAQARDPEISARSRFGLVYVQLQNAQARNPEILGDIRSLASRACICATSKRATGGVEMWILSHFALELLPLSIVVKQLLASLVMIAFNLGLGRIE